MQQDVPARTCPSTRQRGESRASCYRTHTRDGSRTARVMDGAGSRHGRDGRAALVYQCANTARIAPRPAHRLTEGAPCLGLPVVLGRSSGCRDQEAMQASFNPSRLLPDYLDVWQSGPYAPGSCLCQRRPRRGAGRSRPLGSGPLPQRRLLAVGPRRLSWAATGSGRGHTNRSGARPGRALAAMHHRCRAGAPVVGA